ncbi:amidohydrolase family protein, partial [Burkholderia pseudomallei]|nr:amidohydrolase family protein [Burkholderia pseudomallei]MBO3051974.1 amidohydrolase family protein [Burkholderia pseudomallei]MBO7837305.1 amidohydrolase family protein [Burkholderia pseudomallei]MBO7838395.1 amidohydrolase family protein [Burkholderia pseudomallei]MBO7855389.1 amidohydrolase family protein [Burkholderia pseudomallei]
MTQDAQTASAFGIRTIIYHVLMDRWLGSGRRSEMMSTDECIREFQRTSRCTSNSRVSVLPAIGSQFGASPALLVALHEMAREDALPVVIRLDAGGNGISDFHDAYGCSSVSLLSNLGVLDQNLLVFPVTSLNRVDWRLMNASASAIVACDARHLNSIRRSGLSAIDQRFAVRLFEHEEPDEWRCRRDEIVDALTWKGAESLGGTRSITSRPYLATTWYRSKTISAC